MTEIERGERMLETDKGNKTDRQTRKRVTEKETMTYKVKVQDMKSRD